MGKLEEYKRKRHFDRTPEPSGEPEPATGPIQDQPAPAAKRTRLPKPKLPQLEVRPGAEHGDTFVVQKHRATRLHYDFRLAIDGTLKSWAVPKGPSLNSADKRLAVQTEDHPLDYANFEGKIPEGNYGAGTVMVWDRGTFSVIGDASASKQIERGEIKFNLSGEKLRGSFVLVKLKHSEKGNEWLFIKHQDANEDPAWNIDEHDGSVLTGRTIKEIAEELPPKREANPIQPGELDGARKSAMPSHVEPMLATPGEHAFSDPNWLFEIKWDGVRALARIDDSALTLRSRNGADITKRYPELAVLPQAFAASQAIVDGEIVALDERGLSSFERLQERMHVRAPSEHLVSQIPVVYFAFDLLYCDGYDLRKAPLLERKQLLQRLVPTGRPVERHLPAARAAQLQDRAPQGGLAAAGFAYQAQRLALFDGEAHLYPRRDHGGPCLCRTSSRGGLPAAWRLRHGWKVHFTAHAQSLAGGRSLAGRTQAARDHLDRGHHRQQLR
jgi:bifunctional non-homologous end joining protein LigD